MIEFTKEEDKKLREAFALDANPKEAWLETGIDYGRILEWLSVGDRLAEMERLRMKPRWEAKKLVAKEASVSVKDAQWYLERRAKDEFSTKSEVDNKLTGDITITWQE